MSLNRGDRTRVTYSYRLSPHKTAVNAVNADATTGRNVSEPTDTSFNAVGHPRPLAKKTANPSSSSAGSKPSPSNQPVWVPCSMHLKKHKQTNRNNCIDWGVINDTIWVCKPRSPCNDSHLAVSQNNDWAVEGGKPKGWKPKGRGGEKGNGGSEGGKGALYGRCN